MNRRKLAEKSPTLFFTQTEREEAEVNDDAVAQMEKFLDKVNT